MSSAETAMQPTATDALLTVPEEQLQPTTRGQEIGVNLAIYFAVVIPTMIIGTGTGMLAVAIFVVALTVSRRRRWFRANTRLREVREALAADEVERAARVCHALLVEMPRRSLAHTIAVGNWGVIQLRRGRPREAITLLERMLDTGRFRGRMGTLLEVGASTGILALAHAIVGELDEAERRLDEARAQLGEGREGLLFSIASFIDCRSGRSSQVLERFDSQWRSAEPKLTVGSARTARMLQAFALEHVGGDEYRSRTGERLDRALDRAREAPRGAYDYLMVQWPQGQDFLRRHAL